MGHTTSASNNSANGSFSSNTQLASTDLNAHFAKRKQPKYCILLLCTTIIISLNISFFFFILQFRTQKTTLFRFEGSLHSISLNESNSDHSKLDQYSVGTTEKVLIAEPNARLVIDIYQPLMAFVDEIERALGCTEG